MIPPTESCTWPEFHAPDCECRIFNAQANIPPAHDLAAHDAPDGKHCEGCWYEATHCPACGERYKIEHCHDPKTGEPQAPEPRPVFSRSMQRRVEAQIRGQERELCRKLIVLACEEAWDTPGDEWGVAGHPDKPIKTNAQIAFEIADRLMKELP